LGYRSWDQEPVRGGVGWQRMRYTVCSAAAHNNSNESDSLTRIRTSEREEKMGRGRKKDKEGEINDEKRNG
jgi:hypothetical protein